MLKLTPLLLLILTVSWCRAIDVIPKKNEHDIYAIYANANSSSYHKTDVETSAYTIEHRVKEYGQFRYETRMADGVVYGCYGYNDAFGRLRSTHFVADHGGTRILRPYYPSKVYHEEGVATPVQWDDIALPKECQAHEILVNVKPINFKTVADSSKFQTPVPLSKVEALKNTVRNKPETVAGQKPNRLQPKAPTIFVKQQQQTKGVGQTPSSNDDDNSIAISLKAGTLQKPNRPQSSKIELKSPTNGMGPRGGQKFSNSRNNDATPVSGKEGNQPIGDSPVKQMIGTDKMGKKMSNTKPGSQSVGGAQVKQVTNTKTTNTKTGKQPGGEALIKQVSETGKTGSKTLIVASTKTGNQPVGFSKVTNELSSQPNVITPNQESEKTVTVPNRFEEFPKSTPAGFALPVKPADKNPSSALPPLGLKTNVEKLPKVGIQSNVVAPNISSKTQQKVSISLGKSGPSFSGVIDGSKLILKSGKPKQASQNRIPKITDGKPTQIEIVEEDDVAIPTSPTFTGFTTPKFPTFGQNSGFSLPTGFSNPSVGNNNNNINFPLLPQGFMLPTGFPNIGLQNANKSMIGNRVDTPGSNKPSTFGNFPVFPTLPPLPNLSGFNLPTLPNFSSGGVRTGNAIKPESPANSVGSIEPIYNRQKIKEFREMQVGGTPAPTIKADSKNIQETQQKSPKAATFSNPTSVKNQISASSIVGLPLNTKNILPSNIGGPINLPPGFSNASPNLQPVINNVFGKTPSVTNILVGVPQESLKPNLAIAAIGNGLGPEASGSNVVKTPNRENFVPAPAVQPVTKLQASALVSSTNLGPNKKTNSAKVQVSSPSSGTIATVINNAGNRGGFDLAPKPEGPIAQKTAGFNMVPLPDAARPANVPADCPCLLMTSDKMQPKPTEVPVTQAPVAQLPAVQQIFGQFPFANGLPVLGFIPVLFVPYCNAGANTPVNLQSFGLPAALSVPYPCSACI